MQILGIVNFIFKIEQINWMRSILILDSKESKYLTKELQRVNILVKKEISVLQRYPRAKLRKSR
jgi:hypothetical protein